VQVVPDYLKMIVKMEALVILQIALIIRMHLSYFKCPVMDE